MAAKLLTPYRNFDPVDIIHITDTHIFSDINQRFAETDTAATLTKVTASINALDKIPDAILLTGDLVHTPDEQSYERLLGILSPLQVPVFCLPGNHDNPELMQRALNRNDVSTEKVIEGKFWKILLLNSVSPGNESGYLDKEELKWLNEQIKEAANKNIMIALHHHPVPVKSPWMDEMMLTNPDEFFAVLDQYSTIRIVLHGHVHQDISFTRKGVTVLGSPSTCIQFQLENKTSAVSAQPPAFRRIKLLSSDSIQTEVEWI